MLLSLVPILIIATALYYVVNCYILSDKANNKIILLVPDSLLPGDSRVEVWQSAAAEEGLELTLMTDSDFLQPCNGVQQYAGVIMPDQVHKRASDILIQGIKSYVRKGGNLMLVYDAAIWNTFGVYPAKNSRLSEVTGIDYALYPSLLDKTIQWDTVIGSASAFASLTVPPGKFIETSIMSEHRPESKQAKADKYYQLTAYGYKSLRYPAFVTRGSYHGKILLKQNNGNLFAGYNKYGAGNVLFVNTPLGYLKGQTDGLPLHAFLRYFADNILDIPYLAPVPDGIGGIVMNWHLDSRASLYSLQKMKQLGFYEQGPYSIHITAGPDRDRSDDKLGLDVPANPEIKNWIKFFTKRSYIIGSHGGWLHNYFGNKVPATKQPEFTHYLELNKHALEKLLDYPVQEYSSPKGNHPQWITSWLEQQGILAYYFTGDTGMAPTRAYRNGVLRNKKIWAFPIQNYADMTGFDEFYQRGLKSDTVKNWLIALTDFTIKNKTSRLVYFHPRGVLHYPEAARSWLQYAGRQNQENKFRWYTMTELAKFLNTRDQIIWKMHKEGQLQIFEASQPDNTSLAHQTWLLPKDRYHKPDITLGKARIKEDNRHWLVTAISGSRLEFSAARKVP